MRIRLQGSGHAARLLSELNRCRVSRLLCDVELQVGGRSFPAHRAVLACSCSHFSGLLSGRALPNTLALDFVSAAAFEKVLTFIYTGEIFTDLIDVGVLYELAERLGVRELVNACHATFPDLQSSGSAPAPVSSSATSCSSLSSSAPTPAAPSPAPPSRSQPKSEELPLGYGLAPSADALPLALPLKTEQDEGEDAGRGTAEHLGNGSALAAQESVPDSSAQLGSETCAPSSSSVDPLDSLQLTAVAGPVRESDFFQEEHARKRLGSPEVAGPRWSSGDVIELSDEEEQYVVEEEDEEELMCIENGEHGSSMPCRSCGTLLPVENTAIRAHAESHLLDSGACQVCGASFPDRAAGTAHALSHVGILIFSCDVCEQQFRSEAALIHHRRQSAAKCVPQNPEQLDGASQRPGGELQCAICTKSMSNDFKAVRDHLQTHACVRTLRCGVCQRSQPSRCALLWHTLTHLLPLHTCPQCACPFLDSGQLERHLSLHEDGAPGRADEGPEGQVELRCFLCPQTFRSDAAFHYHLSAHSGDLQSGHTWPAKRKAEQLLEFSSSSSSPLEAGGSGKAAFGVSLGFSLQDKMAPGGPFPGGLNGGGAGLREKLYRCRYCGKHFAHSGEFTYHLRIHTGEKPYQCKVCLRFFRGRSTMICHLKTHAGALMYRCTVCGLFFSTLKMVSSHMEVHKDQLPADFNIEETFMYNDHSKDPVPSLES